MALTYTETAWNTAGTAGSSGYFKEVTVSCATGDLLVAFGANGQYDSSRTTRQITTNTGSTSAWTTDALSPIHQSDCDTICGWATVSSGTSVTVRVQLRSVAAHVMGAAVWVIPAAEWTGTPALQAIGPSDTTNYQWNVSLGATSKVLQAAADFAAADPSGIAITPSGTSHMKAIASGSNYALTLSSWTGQTAATRAYGLVSDPGADKFSGAIVAVQEVDAPLPGSPVTYGRLIVIGG